MITMATAVIPPTSHRLICGAAGSGAGAGSGIGVGTGQQYNKRSKGSISGTLDAEASLVDSVIYPIKAHLRGSD